MKVSIVVTSFNGLQLLTKHLPAVVKFSPQADEIIIIDDGADDGSQDFIKSKFPQIRYFKNPQNLGFTRSTNRGVGLAKGELVVLLNNDISPHRNYLKAALPHFKTKSVFAVTFCETASSWPLVSWQNGKLHYTRAPDKTNAHYSLWASGGSSIVRRSHWNRLGGFDPIYSPGYWEDIDIGWRAWKMGLKIIWEPQAKIDHLHEQSFKKLNQKKVSLIRQRNELLFHWANLSDPDLLRSHRRFLATYTLAHPGYLKVIAAALLQVPRLRHQPPSQIRLDDNQVLQAVNQSL